MRASCPNLVPEIFMAGVSGTLGPSCEPQPSPFLLVGMSSFPRFAGPAGTGSSLVGDGMLLVRLEADSIVWSEIARGAPGASYADLSGASELRGKSSLLGIFLGLLQAVILACSSHDVHEIYLRASRGSLSRK